LLLLDRGIVVRLCRLDDRVGYLDTTDEGFSHWVWLTEDRLLAIRSYVGQTLPPDAEPPDFVLRGALSGESVFARQVSEPAEGS
jgi:hypothetical protein